MAQLPVFFVEINKGYAQVKQKIELSDKIGHLRDNVGEAQEMLKVCFVKRFFACISTLPKQTSCLLESWIPIFSS